SPAAAAFQLRSRANARARWCRCERRRLLKMAIALCGKGNCYISSRGDEKTLREGLAQGRPQILCRIGHQVFGGRCARLRYWPPQQHHHSRHRHHRGQPAIIIRTASGKFHHLYRYNGERRRIRPWSELPIDLLGDNGFALAAPSKTTKGSYEI